MNQDTPPPRKFYPQRLQYAFVKVGQPEAEFTATPIRLIGGLVLGLLLVLAGLGAGVWGASEGEAELGLTGLILIPVGLLLAWSMWRVWGQKILVCPYGLVRQRGRQIDTCRWTDLKEVVHLKGKGTYRLVPRKGDDWTIDANSTSRLKTFIECVRARAEQHSISWKVVSDNSE